MFVLFQSHKEDDTVSLYVFGEDEELLQKEAHRNGGVLNQDHVRRHYGDGGCKSVRLCLPSSVHPSGCYLTCRLCTNQPLSCS